ncbi:proline-rich receptor-like protein kinase PERK10 isoform X2 [Choloepus didactylus]|uniref:proline-rich receptor-like protein kinase PERK10 isoform X2 n=1 Tax=Choloepus didactylus TaxID=27675 RepID=UPI0018A0370F|nr:proline-rich receptor-like protein kinase PERK10 isoform X2 [Choloepus didactylus]XP_037704224.1 proline-rich receptor-like protein kinase PERK10 isoform X2 [Choloepus didactylus]
MPGPPALSRLLPRQWPLGWPEWAVEGLLGLGQDGRAREGESRMGGPHPLICRKHLGCMRIGFPAARPWAEEARASCPSSVSTVFLPGLSPLPRRLRPHLPTHPCSHLPGPPLPRGRLTQPSLSPGPPWWNHKNLDLPSAPALCFSPTVAGCPPGGRIPYESWIHEGPGRKEATPLLPGQSLGTAASAPLLPALRPPLCPPLALPANLPVALMDPEPWPLCLPRFLPGPHRGTSFLPQPPASPAVQGKPGAPTLVQVEALGLSGGNLSSLPVGSARSRSPAQLGLTLPRVLARLPTSPAAPWITARVLGAGPHHPTLGTSSPARWVHCPPSLAWLLP